MLKKAGFSNIIEFENGELALNYIEKNFAQIGNEETRRLIMLTDIEMPKMDGLTLCRHLKQNSDLKDIYVIMFSSLINTQMIHKCNKVNADKYVTKPETAQLIEILDDLCKQKKINNWKKIKDCNFVKQYPKRYSNKNITLL